VTPPRTLEDIPWSTEVPEDRVQTAVPRRCSHPRTQREVEIDPGSSSDGPHMAVTRCGRCGHVFDPERMRRGRLSLRRGKTGERRVAKVLGGRRVGQYGGAADVEALFAVQVKAGPSYWPRSLARLLDDHRLAAAALGRAGPAVAYVETGHHGRANRTIVAVYAEDLARALQDAYNGGQGQEEQDG
jgi:hypothetical protein